jgi:hypothetical protein
MWFKNASIEPVKGAASLTHTCDNCGNSTEHVLVDQPYGLTLGLPFTKRPWASTHKAYSLCCPTCGSGFRISKEQAAALIRKGQD